MGGWVGTLACLLAAWSAGGWVMCRCMLHACTGGGGVGEWVGVHARAGGGGAGGCAWVGTLAGWLVSRLVTCWVGGWVGVGGS